MAKNKVILTGFMGCGKSTIGRILAEKRGQELLDTDRYIEQKQGRSISDIFATQGEEVFRDMETEALRAHGDCTWRRPSDRRKSLWRRTGAAASSSSGRTEPGTVSRIRICVLSENHTRGGLPAVKGRYDKASFTDGGSLRKDYGASAAA